MTIDERYVRYQSSTARSDNSSWTRAGGRPRRIWRSIWTRGCGIMSQLNERSCQATVDQRRLTRLNEAILGMNESPDFDNVLQKGAVRCNLFDRHTQCYDHAH